MTGLILLDKPPGMTSFLACAVIRRLSGEKHVGHTGTLDPMATGVLPVLVGRATSLSQYLTVADKSYVATVQLGITTDTYDITGTVMSRSDYIPSREEVIKTVESFKGLQIQTPPIYSAIRVDGQRLYDVARRGGTAEVPQREITVHSVAVAEFSEENCFTMQVSCSKGTYIRSLAHDIGKKLGCGAVLTALRRTETAGFGLEYCVSLDTLKADGVQKYLISPAEILPAMRKVSVSQKQAIRFTNGGALDVQRLKCERIDCGENVCVMFDDCMLGVARVEGEPLQLAPKTVIEKI